MRDVNIEMSAKKFKNKSFNEDFENLIDNRINEMSIILRKNNKEYVSLLDDVEKLRNILSKDLSAEQMNNVEDIIDTLNYISRIEIGTAYKMAINDFNSLKY